MFAQVCLRLYEMRLELCIDIFLIQISPPGLAVLSELPHFCNKDICYSHNLSFRDGPACRDCVVNALVDHHIEALERLVRVELLPQLGVVCRNICCRYPCVVVIQVAEELKHRGSGLARELMIEGGDVGVLKYSQQLIVECRINILTLVVLKASLRVISD